MVTPIKDFKVNVLPTKGEPNSRYYVLKEDQTVEEWITDKDGNYRRVASGLAGVAFEAGTSSAILDRVTFSNSNNVSFGLSGSVITATAGFPQSTQFFLSSLSSAFLQTGYTTHSHSQYLTTQTRFILSNAHGLSFGTATNGTVVTGSYTVPTDYISINQSSLFQQTSLMSNYLGTTYTSHSHSQYLTTQTQFVLSNSNGISFGTNGTRVTASYTVPTDYISTGQSTLFLGTTYTSHTHSYLGSDYTSHTHSQYLTTQTQFVLSNSNGVTFGTNGSTVTASFSAATQSQFVLSNSNGISFGTNGSTVTASYSVPVQTQFVLSNSNGISFGTDGSTVTASYTVPVQTQFVLSNSNGISFGTNGSTVTASVNIPTVSNSSLTVSDANTSGTLARLAFTNLNGITLSLSTSTGGLHTVVGSYTVPTDYVSTAQSSLFEHTSHTTIFLTSQSAQALSGSNGSFTFQTATLGNLNGLSFYSSNGSMVGSYTVPTDYVSTAQSSLFEQTSHTTIFLTSQSNQAASGSNGSFAFQTLSFGNSNGISFYTTNGSVVASVSAPPAAALSSATISAGASSETLASLVFSNANGVSFGLSQGTLTATVQTNYLTTAMESDAGTRFVQANAVFHGTNASGTIASNAISVSVAPSAGNSSLTMQAGGSTLSSVSRVAFEDGNGISFGASTSNNGSITITASHNGLTSQSGQAVSGSNGSFAFQTVTFGNLNGLSFYTSNGSVVGSYTVPGPGGAVFAISASDSSVSSGTVVFSNSNGVSFGMSDSVVTASHNGLTSQSGQALSGSNGSFAFQTATFGNANGFSFLTSNGSMVGSYTVPNVPAQTNQDVSLYATGNTTQNSSTVLNASSLLFNGLGNVSVGFSNGSIQVSATAAGPGGGGPAISAGANSQSTGTVVFQTGNGITFGLSNDGVMTASHNGLTTQTNQNLSLYALGNTTQNSSTVLNASQMSFNGLGAMTWGYSNGSIQASAPNTSMLVGTGAVSVQTNASTISVGAPYLTVTAGNGSSLGSLSNLYFSNANSISFGLSTSNNGNATLTAIYGSIFKGTSKSDNPLYIAAQAGQGSLMIEPLFTPNVGFDRAIFSLNNTNASNSTGSHTLSFWIGIYTRNNSSLSLYASTSNSVAIVQSGTVGNYSLYSGMRGYSIPFTTTLDENQYWLAFLSRSASAGADGSYSNIVLSTNPSLNFAGFFGESLDASMQRGLGNGYYSATTNAVPVSIAFSQIYGDVLRFPILNFASGSIVNLP